MDNYSKYHDALKGLTNSTLFGYQFYEKTDSELIQDCIDRSRKNLEFGLFKLGSWSSKTVPVGGVFPVDTKYIPLFCFDSKPDTNEPSHIIKIASFCYPSYFLCSLLDKKETTRSTFNNQLFNDYGSLQNEIKRYYGKTVLVTTAWHTISAFTKYICSVKIFSTPDHEPELADFIRRRFVIERTSFIHEMLDNPIRYFPFYPVEETLLKEVVVEYQTIFRDELNKLENYEFPNYLGYYNDSPSASELARDNFYALTDGQEGDNSLDLYDDNY